MASGPLFKADKCYRRGMVAAHRTGTLFSSCEVCGSHVTHNELDLSDLRRGNVFGINLLRDQRTKMVQRPED